MTNNNKIIINIYHISNIFPIKTLEEIKSVDIHLVVFVYFTQILKCNLLYCLTSYESLLFWQAIILEVLMNLIRLTYPFLHGFCISFFV